MGGIADSDYVGGENSVAAAECLDIHSEPGIIKLNQALTRNDGGIVDDFVKTGLACSDGNWYFFGSVNGKIWRRDDSGVWTLQATAAPSLGNPGILGSKEYAGYIYYAMENRLGRWQIGSAWGTRNDNWATFLNGDEDWHMMKILNLVLYIGDGNVIAQVDNSSGTAVFANNALDLDTPFRVKSLGQLNTSLLAGTFVKPNIGSSQIFLWNTWSVSFSNSDPIPEVGINSFLANDNFTLVNAGVKGNMYIYDGSQLDLFKQIKGNWDGARAAHVHPEATFNFNGIPLFGLSSITGNPAKMGLYSIARKNRNYPYVLNLEYLLSNGHVNNVEIGCIVGGGSFFFVSWKDSNGGPTYGIDILDLNKKAASGSFTTRISDYDRFLTTTYGNLQVGYRTLPTNTSITAEANRNNAGFSALAMEVDTNRRRYESVDKIEDANTLQVRVILNSDGANAGPEVEQAVINLSQDQ